MKKVIIAGANGLVGSHLLNFLLSENEVEMVVALVRKPLGITHPKLFQEIIDFNKISSYSGLINGSAVFCCLGSTRAKTPDLDDYRRVDYNYPLSLAQIASKNKIEQFHLVSAIGANPKSKNFYVRVKGEVERDIKQLNFKSLHIYKPSLLVGERKEKRLLENTGHYIMKMLNPFLTGRFEKYRSIKGEVVAGAMARQFLRDLNGTLLYYSDQINKLA